MKPHVIVHMGSSIDGRIIPAHWPPALRSDLTAIYERVHKQFAADAWMVGRVTMADFAEGDPAPATSDERFPRTTWKSPDAAKGPYAVAVDQHGKLHLNTGAVNGDPIILILTETVSDAYLAELRRDGISYLFAGHETIDFRAALDILSSEFGIRKLMLEGGGHINGSLLAEGLIDEISLLLMPLADGNAGMPTLFERSVGAAVALTLKSVTELEHGVLHLVYAVGSERG